MTRISDLHNSKLQKQYLDKIAQISNQVAARCKRGENCWLTPLTAKKDAKKTVPNVFTNDFDIACNPSASTLTFGNGNGIDYLGLKNILVKLIEEQSHQMYSGIPDITLDSLVLTVSFEIVIDMTTGAATIFRMFPVIVPATVDFKPDHIHTLKVTLHGVKNKTPVNAKNLYESCRKRLGTKTLNPKEDVCSTQIGQLLESIANSSSNASTGP